MPQQTNHTAAARSARGAGVLMHITSLPSKFGIGDLGPEAYRFADFLSAANQTYWQFLPLNPIEGSQAYSPYSSTSSMAGNAMLISPEKLKSDGLLRNSEFPLSEAKSASITNFQEAERIKRDLFDRAFNNFTQRKSGAKDFKQFLLNEKGWLDDYALYAALKDKFRKPWYEWPADLRRRNVFSMQKLRKELSAAMERIRWEQFIFFWQWSELKKYCNQLNIALVGDVPFYVSYDSSDVWANQEIFSLHANGQLKGMAGVPPDYFNENGQLWGMPVFNWKVLKNQKYRWWMTRLTKNLEMYNLVRLDHFRAFSAYWEVPANEKTARNGKWKAGPGSDFFQAVGKQFPTMPFIAEDLGDIDEKVLSLRDDFSLPGMKVLQFAFGGNMATSDYAPHNHRENFIVYTGTHDNNTTKGWYRVDTGPTERNNLSRYIGKRVTSRNVHLELMRLAYSSVCKVAIIPMQDLLALDEHARMNTPASVGGNWSWRMKQGDLTSIIGLLKEWTLRYNRKGI
jgi:4-alpha-glucanotransferase